MVLLGTTLLDSTKNEFLGIDRWTNADNMLAFYGNPDVAKAFGSLFATRPKVEFFVYEPSWVSWGDMKGASAFCG